jgi:hypothetical protein
VAAGDGEEKVASPYRRWKGAAREELSGGGAEAICCMSPSEESRAGSSGGHISYPDVHDCSFVIEKALEPEVWDALMQCIGGPTCRHAVLFTCHIRDREPFIVRSDGA